MESIHRPAWKYVVILGLDKREHDLKVLLINSPGNGESPKCWANSPEALIKIEQVDYKFLDNEHKTSYINCLTVFDKPLSEVTKEFASHPKAKAYKPLLTPHYLRMRDILKQQEFDGQTRRIINTPI